MLFILLYSFRLIDVCVRVSVCVCVFVPLCAFLFLFGGKIFDEMFCAHFIYAYIHRHSYLYICISNTHECKYISIYICTHTHTRTLTLHLCALISLGAFLKTRTERRAGGREWTCCSGMSSTHTHALTHAQEHTQRCYG